MLKISGAVLSAALLVTTFAAKPAQAAFQLTVTDNSVSNSAVVNDCHTIACIVGIDTDGVGQITTSISQDNDVWFTSHNVNSAQITAAGSPALAEGQMSLTDLDIESSGPTTIKLFLTETNLTSPTGLAILNEALSATSLSGNATVTLQGFEDNTNTLYGQPAASSGPLLSITPTANGASASAASGVLTFASMYSLTEVATITFANAAHLNLNFTGTLAAAPVPEPASMMLFGTVLAGVGLFMRKRAQVRS